MTNYEQMAEQMYAAYSRQAGGLTFDGKPLPSFQELGLERQSCWMAAAEASCAQSPALAATNEVTVLPDGSAFAVYSYPLPKDHWLYAPREYEQGAEEPKELAAPILTHAAREQVVSAIRYAVRAATDCGKETDFDPDALVQNAVYALCGPFNKNQPQPQAVPEGWKLVPERPTQNMCDAAKYGVDGRLSVFKWADAYKVMCNNTPTPPKLASEPQPQAVAPVVLPEPDSYLFQHEDTGQTMFVDAQQVEWGFEANNPRLHKVSGVYTEQQVREMLAATLADTQPFAFCDELFCEACGQKSVRRIDGAALPECIYETPQPQEVPVFNHVAARKLKELQERGYAITGYAFEKVDSEQTERGFITSGGFVGWWKGEHTNQQPQADAMDAELLDWLEGEVCNSYSGVTITRIDHREEGMVIERGFRLRRFHKDYEVKPTLRAAIAAAKENK